MISSKYDTAWGDFWADNATGTDGGGCLPAGWRGIDAAQRAAWCEFGDQLPRKARVLDLATGDGRVMAWLLTRKPDIKAIGVDLAPVLPPAPPGTKNRAGLAMENLPFPHAQFDAVVSQFGFEYGNVEETALQIAQVLKPDGTVGLMTHRADGPILAHNIQRRKQIRWVSDELGLFDKALGSLRLRATGIAAVPEEFAQAPADGARQFGQGSVAWEISEAIRQTLQLGLRDHPQNVAQLLQKIRAKAENELGRIDSLERACHVADDRKRLTDAFSEAGLVHNEPAKIVERATERSFADFWTLRMNS